MKKRITLILMLVIIATGYILNVNHLISYIVENDGEIEWNGQDEVKTV